MTSRNVSRGARARELCAWSDDTLLALMRRFVDENGLHARPEEFLDRTAEEELDEGGPGWDDADED